MELIILCLARSAGAPTVVNLRPKILLHVEAVGSLGSQNKARYISVDSALTSSAVVWLSASRGRFCTCWSAEGTSRAAVSGGDGSCWHSQALAAALEQTANRDVLGSVVDRGDPFSCEWARGTGQRWWCMTG